MIVEAPIIGNTVELFRGKVDLYTWRGKTVARKWPTYTPYQPSAAQQAQRDLFKNTVLTLQAQPLNYQLAMRDMPLPPGKSCLDVMRKYIRAAYKLM